MGFPRESSDSGSLLKLPQELKLISMRIVENMVQMELLDEIIFKKSINYDVLFK